MNDKYSDNSLRLSPPRFTLPNPLTLPVFSAIKYSAPYSHFTLYKNNPSVEAFSITNDGVVLWIPLRVAMRSLKTFSMVPTARLLRGKQNTPLLLPPKPHRGKVNLLSRAAPAPSLERRNCREARPKPKIAKTLRFLGSVPRDFPNLYELSLLHNPQTRLIRTFSDNKAFLLERV